MLSREITLSVLAVFMISGSETTIHDEVLPRSRRQLLFPNSTLLQLNIGVGTPSPADKINVNWAFQANFQLPWNRSQIPVDILEANTGYIGGTRKKREIGDFHAEENDGYKSDAKLYHFYKYVEEALDSFGQNGSSCVLQTLCRLGAEPLQTAHDEDLLHDIASFVFNPTNDVALGLKETDKDYRYIQAYKYGKQGRDCMEVYRGCTTSLIDMFSILHEEH